MKLVKACFSIDSSVIQSYLNWLLVLCSEWGHRINYYCSSEKRGKEKAGLEMREIDGRQKELVPEDYCFVCKDGGTLLTCNYRDCTKAYHPACVGKGSSYLETAGLSWECGWHSCFFCKKSSTIKCFCCPKSVCLNCFKRADFVHVSKNSMGFCSYCLKLAKLIEENSVVDSDGNKVDFNDTEAYEFLFKDYWEIVKDRENVPLEELRAAYASVKDGTHLKYNPEKSGARDENDSDTGIDSDFQDANPICDVKIKSSSFQKRSLSKRKNFIGWGSEQLIIFMVSIGKDCKEPITQLDASAIIKRYILDKKLLHPKKKKKVLCDEKLYSLFRRKSIKLLKIYDLLESHFSLDIDDIFFDSEEDEESVVTKKQRAINSEPKNVPEFARSTYAGIVHENIKLIYLRRSLILNFLKNLEEFENKVVGCFVRVRSDRKDFLYSWDRIYQLGQVTGIKKSNEIFKIGEINTNIVLRVSNMFKDIQISMLSDDDFEKEECEELRKMVKEGLLKRLTIAEFELKSSLVHEDITRHWINKEIAALQKQIDRANEKGWRRELHELIERRELLRTSAEQTRLLKEIPQVIPDNELVEEGSFSSQKGNEGTDEVELVFNDNVTPGKSLHNVAPLKEHTPKRILEDAVSDISPQTVRDGSRFSNLFTANRFATHDNGAERNSEGNGTSAQNDLAKISGKDFSNICLFSF